MWISIEVSPGRAGIKLCLLLFKFCQSLIIWGESSEFLLSRPTLARPGWLIFLPAGPPHHYLPPTLSCDLP